jgi:hypothetical protein
MDEDFNKMEWKSEKNVSVHILDQKRGPGLLFDRGDRVRINHGVENAKAIRDNPRNRKPPSMEQDSSLGKFGYVVSVLDRNNKWHEKVYSGDGYETFCLVKIRYDDPFKYHGIITDDCIEYVEIDCLVNYSLLGEAIAEDLYSKSHDRDLPQYKAFYEYEIMNQEIMEVIDNAVVHRFCTKYNLWQKQSYLFYYELLEDSVNMRKMYIRDVHKWYAENPPAILDKV